ncbi:zinc finger protein 888-like [Folsomia candida]|uniref:Zinc finger protein 62 n=1 Tax=Folsomia candida TaxID=158441 RepID=A0A226D229_FOLCA|nr:zinc finger protein 888-like [Folsomia candida]OXA39269.1 Zinc finger protein 62 [Folsomia candida]
MSEVTEIGAPLECLVCQKYFPTKTRLRHHVAIHQENRGIKCEIRGKVVKDLGIHKSNVHKNRVRPACEICKKTFSSSQNLQVHKNAFHNERTDRPRLPCWYSDCDKTYLTKAEVRKHVGRVRSEDPIRFRCKLCGKELRSGQGLGQHIATHTTEKSFTCSVCGKGFIHLSNFKQHQLIHQDKATRKEFLCKICPQTFLSRQGVAYHARVFHENQKYSCDKCCKKFVTTSTLKRHMAAIHPSTHERMITYACDNCEYQSHLKFRLKIHSIRCHAGNGHYECYFCAKQYFTYGYLTRHVARHNLEV